MKKILYLVFEVLLVVTIGIVIKSDIVDDIAIRLILVMILLFCTTIVTYVSRNNRIDLVSDLSYVGTFKSENDASLYLHYAEKLIDKVLIIYIICSMMTYILNLQWWIDLIIFIALMSIWAFNILKKSNSLNSN